MPSFRLACLGLAAGLLAALGACGPGPGTGLAPGLTACMDVAGARLDRGEALRLGNAYRTTTGAGALTPDPSLEATADRLASQYAGTGTAPALPGGVSAMRVSAGYSSFAETFSGWRNSSADAAAMARPGARRAGIGVAYAANSGYGIYWVLLLAD